MVVVSWCPYPLLANSKMTGIQNLADMFTVAAVAISKLFQLYPDHTMSFHLTHNPGYRAPLKGMLEPQDYSQDCRSVTTSVAVKIHMLTLPTHVGTSTPVSGQGTLGNTTSTTITIIST